MSPEEQALARVVAVLRELSVPFMLTGSVAASYHGRPRTTHDADLVIDPGAGQLEAPVTRLQEAGFYVDRDGARDALVRRTQFNVIETAHACKVDLILRRDRPFSKEEFARRVAVRMLFADNVTV